MALSSPGVGSNLDVNSIVGQLMATERRPVSLLDQKEAGYQAKLSAYGSLKSALASFQSSMSGLNSVSRFQSLSATAADTTILTASAGSTAAPGSYTVVAGPLLAQAQTIAAAGRTSTSAAIGAAVTTTLTFKFGTISGGTLTDGVYSGATFTQDATQVTGTVTLDSSNNSLQGIRDAINAADIGVTATVVNDGGASPYRLVLASNATGTSKSMKISVAGDATLQGVLAYDPEGTQNLTQSTAAQNAALTVNGIAVSSASNTVTGAIQGVTLNLAKAGTTTLSVARDTAAAQSAATAFVTAYNGVNNTLASLSAYNATTKKGAVLQGDSTVRALQSQIRSALGSTLTGSGGSLTVLSQIGIALQKDGTMALDTTKLATATASNFNDIAGLFAAVGKPTDSLVSFVSSTANSKPGSYAVNVSTLATQGSETGGATAAGLTINTGVNDELLVVLDGVSATVTLPAGAPYASAAALAAQVQSSINGAAAFVAAGNTVSVTESAGVINITSNRYGSGSSVSITGNGLLDLLGLAPVSTTGVDAAGTIGGLGATGAGQSLTGTTGGVTEGLKIQVVGGATGARGTLNFSQGYAYQLNTIANNFLDATGPITSRTDGIIKSITDIGNRRTAFNLRMVTVEARYRAQFTALDTMISSMTQTSNFLSQQLTILSNNN
jgi:flagellar hook-associated protein 2